MDGSSGADACAERWLRYARAVVSDASHQDRCRGRGGSDQHLGFADDVRWPGYLGERYRPGGVLVVANIHRNFDSDGLGASFAREAEDCIRAWRDGHDDDAVFLRRIRAVYGQGLRTWRVGSWPRKVLDELGISIDEISFTNAARCQAIDTGATLQTMCLQRWPLVDLIADLQPGLVLLTSATALASMSAGDLPCLVVAFSQRNGRLLIDSPWTPPEVEANRGLRHWAPLLAAAVRTR